VRSPDGQRLVVEHDLAFRDRDEVGRELVIEPAAEAHPRTQVPEQRGRRHGDDLFHELEPDAIGLGQGLPLLERELVVGPRDGQRPGHRGLLPLVRMVMHGTDCAGEFGECRTEVAGWA
jgi:hypothetical protein